MDPHIKSLTLTISRSEGFGLGTIGVASMEVKMAHFVK